MRRPISDWVAAFAVGVMLAVSPQRASAQNTHDLQREAPEVRQLVITGVKHVDVHDLERSISTQATKCRSLLLEPFCLLSHSRTFQGPALLRRRRIPSRRAAHPAVLLEARISRGRSRHRRSRSLAPRQARVTFDVHENRPTLIRKIAISYDSTLISNKIRDRLTLLHANDPLDLVVLDSMRVLFQNELWDQRLRRRDRRHVGRRRHGARSRRRRR